MIQYIKLPTRSLVSKLSEQLFHHILETTFVHVISLVCVGGNALNFSARQQRGREDRVVALRPLHPYGDS
jgi:hypothetical protein